MLQRAVQTHTTGLPTAKK